MRPYFLNTFQTVSSAGDKVLKCRRLWRTVYVQLAQPAQEAGGSLLAPNTLHVALLWKLKEEVGRWT